MFYLSNSPDKDIINTQGLINAYMCKDNTIGFIYDVNKDSPRLFVHYHTREQRDKDFERFINFLVSIGLAKKQPYFINIEKR